MSDFGSLLRIEKKWNINSYVVDLLFGTCQFDGNFGWRNDTCDEAVSLD